MFVARPDAFSPAPEELKGARRTHMSVGPRAALIFSPSSAVTRSAYPALRSQRISKIGIPDYIMIHGICKECWSPSVSTKETLLIPQRIRNCISCSRSQSGLLGRWAKAAGRLRSGRSIQRLAPTQGIPEK